MIETASQHDIKTLEKKIAALYRLFLKNGDVETADKAKQLLKKLDQQEYAIAFCGHFSAGKSSMINQIIGENLLPSSPIPTSANLVKIKSGEEYAKVNFKEGNPRLYPAPYNYEKVKSYAKDGDSIQSIEISHQTNKLPNDACIMDTPGIDSTDDAHRVATESALHLADLIFYVMDYNHVQSELNFLFTKELTEAGKEVYLVINQIDKHRDEELSFQDFKQSVVDSFADWGVKPAEIFYTSLKVEGHPLNEYKRLKQFIHSKLDQRGVLLPKTIFHSLKKLTEEFQSYVREQDSVKLLECKKVLSGLLEEEQSRLPQKVEKVEQALKEMVSRKRAKEKAFEDGFEDILKSAYLMPFETRALAESYLQASQPDFKVGLFFAKQKTEQEKQDRLEKFLLDFQEKVDAQLTWHIKEFLNDILKAEEIHDQTLLSEIQSFTVVITKEMLGNAVKTGARLTGEYVLNYTADVAELAKKEARKNIMGIKESFLTIVQVKFNNEEAQLEEEKRELTIYLQAWKQKQGMIESQLASNIRMEQILNGEIDAKITEGELAEIKQEKVDVEVIQESDFKTDVEEGLRKPSRPSHSRIVRKVDNEERVASVVSKLSQSARKLIDIPGFKNISTLLTDKAERLEQRSFTVALFGAFSAGKSSFANSLIGEKILPVSPNPTTAAINKIMPIDNHNSHGVVKVQLKSSEVLLEDIILSLEVFGFSAGNFDEALEQIKQIIDNVSSFDTYEKTHYSFLHAFYKGFGEYRDQLGDIIETDLEQFKDFVANEEKSCLVELIEVYYDCDLTRKGITLVDTPGADSINARHTGVAFDYIKNSDAILFVTYYNHAFSKADREFLIQLGRVKDSFAMDKMFFIVNAVDLANDETEKEEVLTYVNDQLVKYGIRKPSLFPISSLLAIQEKLEGGGSTKSGMALFEEHFYSFITHDLTEISIRSALFEWERALEQLRSFIHSANEDIEEKQKKLVALKEQQANVEKLITGHSREILQRRLEQEIKELTYYVKQRVFLRFNDFFREAFNPSVLRDDGRNLKKALAHALDDFLEDLGFDFAQELRATSLRIEVFIGKLVEEAHETVVKSLHQFNDELSFSKYEQEKMDGLGFENQLSQLDRELFKKTLANFKNPKSFFEKNEKRFMQEALHDVLGQPVDKYLDRETSQLLTYYEEGLTGQLRDCLTLIMEEAKDYYEGMYAALGNEVPLEKLIELERELANG